MPVYIFPAARLGCLRSSWAAPGQDGVPRVLRPDCSACQNNEVKPPAFFVGRYRVFDLGK